MEEGVESDNENGSAYKGNSINAASNESPNPIRAVAAYNTGQPAQEDEVDEMLALGGDPLQALPAHRTEGQPPEFGIAPHNNDNLETIQQREDVRRAAAATAQQESGANDNGLMAGSPVKESDKNNEE